MEMPMSCYIIPMNYNCTHRCTTVLFKPKAVLCLCMRFNRVCAGVGKKKKKNQLRWHTRLKCYNRNTKGLGLHSIEIISKGNAYLFIFNILSLT